MCHLIKKKIKFPFKNVYLFIEIDFSSSFCSLKSSKFKKKKRKKIYIYSPKINIWNESALFMDKTVLLRLVLPAKCRSGCGSYTSFLSGRVLQEVHSNLSVGNSLTTLEHYRNSMHKGFKVHMLVWFCFAIFKIFFF